MEDNHLMEKYIEPAKLAGLLADETRLKAVAAVILGASSLEKIRDMTGLEEAALMKALSRLQAGGLVEYEPESEYRVRAQVFGESVRRGGKSEKTETIRLDRLPKSRDERLAVLSKLAELFEPGRRYPEKEVNDKLKNINPDYALLRRSLIDEGFLKREDAAAPAGHTVVIYWRAVPG
jgi:hypothetical protein